MRKTDMTEKVNKLNSLFEKYNQQLRIVEWFIPSGRTKELGYILLNNGIKLTGKERATFNSRMSKDHELWVKNADRYFTENDAVSKEIKRWVCSLGGKMAWEKAGDKIRESMKGRPSPCKGRPSPLRGRKLSEETKRKISIANSGVNNGMYGRKMSEEEKKKKSDYIKRLIQEGKFTPNTNNRLVHYDSVYDGKRFRSSWEALFYATHPNYEYEKLRILYEWEDGNHVYIVDFISKTEKMVVEVRPFEMTRDARTVTKLGALRDWCMENDYVFRIYTQNDVLNDLSKADLTKFDDITRKRLLATKPIKEEYSEDGFDFYL